MNAAGHAPSCFSLLRAADGFNPCDCEAGLGGWLECESGDLTTQRVYDAAAHSSTLGEGHATTAEVLG